MAKRASTAAYKRKYAEINKFVKFAFPKKLTPLAKRKITNAHKIVKGYTHEDDVGNREHIPGLYNENFDVPVFVEPKRVKGRKPTKRAVAAAERRLRIIRKSEGQDHAAESKWLKPVVFVRSTESPTQPGKLVKPKIRIVGGRVVKALADSTQTSFDFSEPLNALEDDGDIEAYLRSEVERIMEESDDQYFAIQAGKGIIVPVHRSRIEDYVLFYFQKYDGMHMHDSRDWMLGLVAHDFHSSAQRDEHVDRENEKRKRLKKKRRKERYARAKLTRKGRVTIERIVTRE